MSTQEETAQKMVEVLKPLILELCEDQGKDVTEVLCIIQGVFTTHAVAILSSTSSTIEEQKDIFVGCMHSFAQGAEIVFEAGQAELNKGGMI